MGWTECLTSANCYNTAKTGQNLVAGLVISLVVGLLCYVGFVLWRGRFKIYYARLELPQVRVKPPPLKLGGHWQLWSWLLPVFQVRDAELLQIAGLDALMAMRIMRFGIMMFTVLAFFGVVVLLPVNYTAGYVTVSSTTSTDTTVSNGTDTSSTNSTDILSSAFMRMTMSNVPPKSGLLWLHFCFVYLFVGWTCHLLIQYNKEYVALKQVYAVQGSYEASKGLPSSRSLNSSTKSTAGSAASQPKLGSQSGALSASGLRHRQRSGSAAGATEGAGSCSGGSGSGAGTGKVDSEQQQQQQQQQQQAEEGVQLGEHQFTLSEDSYGPLSPGAPAAGHAEHAEHAELAARPGEPAADGAKPAAASAPKMVHPPALKSALHASGTSGAAAAASGAGHGAGAALLPGNGSSLPAMDASIADLGKHRSSVTWSDLAGQSLVARMVAAEEQVQQEEADEEWWEAHRLFPGRYTVLVVDEALQRFKLRSDEHGGFLRTALPSFRLARVDPKSNEAKLKKGVLSKAWGVHKSEPSERREQIWAERNYRMNMAGSTFAKLFGADFDRIIPIFPTREVDALQTKLAAHLAQRDRLLLELGELEEKLGHEEAVAAEAGKGSSTSQGDAAGGAAAEGQLLQQEQQQDEEGGSDKAVSGKSAGEQPPAAGSAAQRASSGGAAAGWGAAWAARKAARQQARLQKLRGRLAAVEEAVRHAREDMEAKRREVLEGPPCASFFVTFKSQEAAMLAANVNLNPLKERMFEVMPAPEPDDVNWGTVQRGWWARNLRPAVVLLFILFIMLLPIGAFTGIGSQLAVTLCPTNSSSSSTLNASNSWFCSDATFATFFRNFVTAWLPSLLLSLYQAVVLPRYIYMCAQSEAMHFSLSAIDMRCCYLSYYWNVFNVFLGALLGGSLANAIQTLLDGDAQDFFKMLGNAIPASSNFFINYVSFRCLAMVPFQLFFPNMVVLAFILKWLHILPWAKTPHDKAMEAPPRNIRLGREIGTTIMSVVVASSGYAVVSPLILPFALLFFLMIWAVYRYQMMYVFHQTAFESDGQIWTYASHQFVGCLTVMSVFTAAMLGVKEAYSQSVIMIFTLVPFLIMFDRYLRQRYDAVIANLPAATTLDTPKHSIDPTIYAPPPLKEKGWEISEWNPEWGKAWQHWGMPRYGL